MPTYIAILHKDPISGYSVSFPDFPGCLTQGETLDEAGRMAEEALQGHVEGMEEFGEAIPAPMSLEAAQAHEFAQGAASFIAVRIPEREGSTVRVAFTS